MSTPPSVQVGDCRPEAMEQHTTTSATKQSFPMLTGSKECICDHSHQTDAKSTVKSANPIVTTHQRGFDRLTWVLERSQELAWSAAGWVLCLAIASRCLSQDVQKGSSALAAAPIAANKTISSPEIEVLFILGCFLLRDLAAIRRQLEKPGNTQGIP